MYRSFIATAVALLAGAAGLSAQVPQGAAAGRAAIAHSLLQRGALPSVLPGTRASAFTTIQGNALSSSNGSLANSMVRLRDARLGQIVDSQVTDKAGLFAFHAVDPGSYVVELVGNDQTVLAASQVLSVDAGQAVSAVVRLPFRIPPFAGLIGHTAPQAATVTTAAAASGVLATAVPGQDATSDTPGK